MKCRTLRESQARFNIYVNARPSIHSLEFITRAKLIGTKYLVHSLSAQSCTGSAQYNL